MHPIGRVVALWRYPVKSFLGERLEEAVIGPGGVEGDRAFALRNASTGHVLSAKKYSMLLRAEAATRNGGVEMTLPEGDVLTVGAPDAAERLSGWLGLDVRIDRAPGGHERPVVEGDNGVFRGRPGGFFDSSAIHILTTSTLAALTDVHPGGRFDPRRFRPNVVLETSERGFVEERWIGAILRIGDAEIEITKPCSRCVMTTHAQEDLPVDRDILRTVIRANDEHVGVYGIARTAGAVRLGDAAMIST